MSAVRDLTPRHVGPLARPGFFSHPFFATTDNREPRTHVLYLQHIPDERYPKLSSFRAFRVSAAPCPMLRALNPVRFAHFLFPPPPRLFLRLTVLSAFEVSLNPQQSTLNLVCSIASNRAQSYPVVPNRTKKTNLPRRKTVNFVARPRRALRSLGKGGSFPQPPLSTKTPRNAPLR
jgi:hypothetical protein